MTPDERTRFAHLRAVAVEEASASEFATTLVRSETLVRILDALADAEAKLVKAREALTKAADHIEGVTGSNERPGSDSAEIVDEVRATIKSLTET